MKITKSSIVLAVFMSLLVIGVGFLEYAPYFPTFRLLQFQLRTLFISYGLIALAFLFVTAWMIIRTKESVVDAERLKINWQHEEIRGIFVLGIIATLLTIRTWPEIVTGDPTGGYFLATINLLSFYWGTYLFLMATAIPNDLIDKRIGYASFVLAQVLFFSGCVLMPQVALWIVLTNLTQGLILNPKFLPLIVVIIVFVGFFTPWLFWPHEKRAQ